MSQDDIYNLMKSSTNQEEWDANVAKVKEGNNGELPEFWQTAIVDSEELTQMVAGWS